MKYCYWFVLVVVFSLASLVSANTVSAAETEFIDPTETPLRKFASPRAGSWSSQVVTSSPQVATITPSFGEMSLNTEPDGSGEDFTRDTPPFNVFDFYLVMHVDFAEVGRGGENPTNGVSAWETGVNIPPELSILGRQLFPPGSFSVVKAGDFAVASGMNFGCFDSDASASLRFQL